MRPDWRDLPPVEPVDRPERVSQSLLKHGNVCMRSAYLYLRYGSAPSVELDRGTAFHVWAEPIPGLLLVNASDVREGATEGETLPATPVLETDVAKDLMDAVLDEHPDLGVTAEDAVHLREMAYHMAGDERGRAGQRKPDGKPCPVGFDWRPQDFIASEQLFALDVEETTVVGKADLVRIGADGVLDVTDFKTQMFVTPAHEFQGTFQLKLYIAAVLFGQPMTRVRCPECMGYAIVKCLNCGNRDGLPTASSRLPAEMNLQLVCSGECVDRSTETTHKVMTCGACAGDGYIETREPSIGDRIQWARGSEVYPRFLSSDGTVVTRTAVYSRAEIQEFLGDLARVVRRVNQAFEDWKWPAIRGTHCGICPARSQCPLPEALRSHAGEVNTLEEASEAAEWADAQADLVRATREEIKRFAKHHQVTVPVGLDEEYMFEVREAFKTDWEALEEKVERARSYGEPFSWSEVRRRSTSTSFVKRKREAVADAQQ